MTHLRKIMLEELHRRLRRPPSMSSHRRTLLPVLQRSRKGRNPQYQAALFKKWKLAPNGEPALALAFSISNVTGLGGQSLSEVLSCRSFSSRRSLADQLALTPFIASY